MTPTFTPGELTVYNGPAELAKVTAALRGVGRKVALVPTMGALHAGHEELISRARRIPGTTVVVSIFVNPLQFGEHEDLDRYPKTFDDDIDICEKLGAELVFAPGVDDMYADGDREITVEPGPLARELEGAARPGHFSGVLTVVAKLLNIVGPDYVFFGEKDYQQLVLVKRMVRALNFGAKVVGVPTVREPDGLALSSRNRYLDADGREAAVALSAALVAAARAAPRGADAVLAAAREVLAAAPAVATDYLSLRDPELRPIGGPGPARLLVAARVGATRLIDNIAIDVGGDA